MQTGRYYIGRVIKLGQLNQKLLMDAIIDPPVVDVGKFKWTITDTIDRRGETLPYLFGHLSKFHLEGQVTKVDTDENSQIDEIAENLLIASSPFVYLPQYSGIAYLHVWNQIQENVFPRRFKSIIEAAFHNFFVECTVEPITDYNTFISKLLEINQFTEISAKVHPPNPLFGRLWKNLKEYVDERNASELSIKEVSTNNDGLCTDLVDLMKMILENPHSSPNIPPSITDTALLMAADGYGSGRVTGKTNGEIRIIKTSDTKKSFTGTKDPVPSELAQKAAQEFEIITKERDMHH